jgi:hypothetical protein
MAVVCRHLWWGMGGCCACAYVPGLPHLVKINWAGVPIHFSFPHEVNKYP